MFLFLLLLFLSPYNRYLEVVRETNKRASLTSLIGQMRRCWKTRFMEARYLVEMNME